MDCYSWDIYGEVYCGGGARLRRTEVGLALGLERTKKAKITDRTGTGIMKQNGLTGSAELVW
jgi:hypothetical protein